MTIIAVDEIARRLNRQAEIFAPKWLPNGHRSGTFWMASGIADTGKSASLHVSLKGESAGHWVDEGNCRADEHHGDMLDLLRLTGRFASVREAVAEAKLLLGIEDERPAEALSAEEKIRREAELKRIAAEGVRAAEERRAREIDERLVRINRAKGLYLSGELIAGTPAEQYLRQRWLEPVAVGGERKASWPGALRYHPDVWCSDERVKVPAMLAPFYLADGRQVATHRTYLQHDSSRGWVKIDSPSPKKVLGPMLGAFIPLNKGESGLPMAKMPGGEAIYITEGIENGVAVRMKRPQARIVAAGTLGNIGEIVFPPQARNLVIVADRDRSEAAQATLERVIGKQQARGLDIGLVMPPAEFNDFNDWLIAVAKQSRRRPQSSRGNMGDA